MVRIDLKTAKAPAITIPLSLLLRVDQVNQRSNVTHRRRLSRNSPFVGRNVDRCTSAL